MKNEWYMVKGNTRYRGENCHLLKAKILVMADSVEDACEKARNFLKPVADFEPTKCKWEHNEDDD